MNLSLKMTIKATLQSRAEAAGLLKSPGDAVLVSRGRPRWLLILCPCGCGAELPVNLDSRAGPAWRLYFDRMNRVGLYPSVWRDTDCRSHFIVWRDQIYLFGHGWDETRSSRHGEESEALRSTILSRFPESEYVSYVDIADSLGEVPWDVLDVCRGLVRNGIVREGSGERRGTFARVHDPEP